RRPAPPADGRLARSPVGSASTEPTGLGGSRVAAPRGPALGAPPRPSQAPPTPAAPAPCPPLPMTARPLSDPQLLDMARTGDDGAFAELRSRHRTAATRLAASYRQAGDPEALVAEAFEEALRALRRGTGPCDAFRAHLFATLRRVAADRTAREGDAALGELPEPLLAVAATPLRPADRQLIIDAF